ncbi:MAG: hypothetical protein AAGL49_07825 [Pseudomonadota bacterium]
MSDRLKEIWKGFEAASGRELTDVNAARGLPDLEDESPTEEQVKFEAEFERPADAAIEAIRELKSSGGKTKDRKRRALFKKPEPTEDTPVFDDGAETERSTLRERPNYLDAIAETGGRPLYSFEAPPRRKGWFGLGKKKRK